MMVGISPARLNTMSGASRRATPPLPPLGSLCALLIALSRGRCEAFAEGKESPACTPEPRLPARPLLRPLLAPAPLHPPGFQRRTPPRVGGPGPGPGPGRPAAEGRALP